jgi:uncharacterized repeat protein (TIGR02543 family)
VKQGKATRAAALGATLAMLAGAGAVSPAALADPRAQDQPGDSGSNPGTGSTHTVTFDTGVDGQTYPPQTVNDANAADLPTPTNGGSRFDGWYSGETRYDDSTPITQDVTLTARWSKAVMVTVEYGNGQEDVSVPAFEHDLFSLPATLDRAGYRFTGWSPDPTTPLSEDTTFTAQWVAVHQVTFDSDGGSAVDSPQSVDDGTPIAKPDDPTKDGQLFSGWTLASTGAPYDFSQPVTGDLSLRATWRDAVHQVTFDVNGGTSVDAQSVPDSQSAAKPADPTKAGARFDAWLDAHGDPYDFSQPVTGDVRLTARWVTQHTVTFDTGDGGSPVPSQSVDDKGTATKPADPTRDGFRFDGWDYDFSAPVTGDVTVTAKWHALHHTVTFDTGGGSAIAPKTVDDGSAIGAMPANPTRAGYRFAGWLGTDGKAFNASTPITDDTTITAKWVAQVTVTFDPAGGALAAPASQTFDANANASKPADPTKEDSEFLGWFAPGASAPFDFANTPVTADLTLTARWKALHHMVTFDAKGGKVAGLASLKTTVATGSPATKPEDPTWAAHRFDGWYGPDGAKYDFATPVDDDITLTARWTALYDVTFDSEGGSQVASQTVPDGETIKPVADPAKAWNAFRGWTLDGRPFAATTPITKSITLKATWAPASLTVVAFGALPADGVKTFNSDKPLPASLTVTDGTDSFTAPQVSLTHDDSQAFGRIVDTGIYAQSATGGQPSANVTVVSTQGSALNVDGIAFARNGDGTWSATVSRALDKGNDSASRTIALSDGTSADWTWNAPAAAAGSGFVARQGTATFALPNGQKGVVHVNAQRSYDASLSLSVSRTDASGNTSAIPVMTGTADAPGGPYALGKLPHSAISDAYRVSYAAGPDVTGVDVAPGLGAHGERTFAVTIHYLDANGAAQTSNASITLPFDAASAQPSAPSSAALKAILVNGQPIAGWNPDVLDYTIVAPDASTTYLVSPQAGDGQSVVAGDSVKSAYATKQLWTVTGPDGAKRAYSVTVVRPHTTPTADEKFVPALSKDVGGSEAAPDATSTALRSYGYVDKDGKYTPVAGGSMVIPDGGTFAYETYAGQVAKVTRTKVSGTTWSYDVDVLSPDGAHVARTTVKATYVTPATHAAALTGVKFDGAALKGFDPNRHDYTVGVDNPDRYVITPLFDAMDGMSVSVRKTGHTATVTVTSADGLTVAVYTFHVTTRELADAINGVKGASAALTGNGDALAQTGAKLTVGMVVGLAAAAILWALAGLSLALRRHLRKSEGESDVTDEGAQPEAAGEEPEAPEPEVPDESAEGAPEE